MCLQDSAHKILKSYHNKHFYDSFLDFSNNNDCKKWTKAAINTITINLLVKSIIVEKGFIASAFYIDILIFVKY